MSATTRPIPERAIDVNVHIGRWPFRRLPLDEIFPLKSGLMSIGVTQAWAGNFDALLHRDVHTANEWLNGECRVDDTLLPFGAVNPALPDWEDDLRRCHEVFRMPGIRLYPNYHGYTLGDPVFARLLELATAAGLLVQVAVSMEDERTQHRLVRVPPVDMSPLPAVLAKLPNARVMLLGAIRSPRGGPLGLLAKTEQVSFDISALETVGGVALALEHVPPDRLLYGSHAPFYYPEAAAMKMSESVLPDDVRLKILSANAKRLLPAPK
jgi:predicted TIM-barrel fold metal-dependent hydrolase